MCVVFLNSAIQILFKKIILPPFVVSFPCYPFPRYLVTTLSFPHFPRLSFLLCSIKSYDFILK